jgi:hypothetical protein
MENMIKCLIGVVFNATPWGKPTTHPQANDPRCSKRNNIEVNELFYECKVKIKAFDNIIHSRQRNIKIILKIHFLSGTTPKWQ